MATLQKIRLFLHKQLVIDISGMGSSYWHNSISNCCYFINWSCFISVHVWFHWWNCPSQKKILLGHQGWSLNRFSYCYRRKCFIQRIKHFVMCLVQLLFCYLTWIWFPVCRMSATYMHREKKVICHQAILLEYKFQLYIDFGELMVCLLELVINK